MQMRHINHLTMENINYLFKQDVFSGETVPLSPQNQDILLGGRASQRSSRGYQAGKLQHKVIFGIQVQTKTSKFVLKSVSPVKLSRLYQQWYHFIHGYGQHIPGNGYMLILLGLFMGKTYLLVVDAHSKCPEIIEISSTTTNKTIICSLWTVCLTCV